MRHFAVFAAAVLVGFTPQQTPPDSDVFLAGLTLSNLPGSPIGVASPENITRRPGYDNQPAFMADESAVFYTSIRDGQADIYRYDIRSRRTSRVTNTPESEYSPTLMPGGKRFSVIRVERDSTQRLWSFRMDGSDPRLVLRTIKPVGYHAWLDETHVAVYVLGRPATLQLVDTRTEHADTVARDIGRSLVPSGLRAVSFDVRQPNGRFLLERLTLDAATGKSQIARIAELPNGAEFVAWTPRGDAITSSGTTLYSLRPGESTWRMIGDFATDGLRDISRLAVSPNGHWLAIVAMPR